MHKIKLLITTLVIILLSPLLALINWGSFSSLDIGLVTDAGSIFDRSFNQSAWEGIKEINQKASESLDAIQPLGHTPSQLINAYSVHVAAKKKYVVTPGFYNAAGIIDFNQEGYSKDMNFILLDAEVKAPNVASVVYETAASGFLAGNLTGLYLNAKKALGEEGYDDLKVGMWGGGNFPGVTDFMVGFAYGINYFNQKPENANKKIKFVKFGDESQYTDSGFGLGQGKSKAQFLLSEGAQVLLPVAGPQASDALLEIQKTSLKNQKIIGVDSDAAIKFTDQKQFFITSILKDLTKTVVEVYKAVIGKQTPDSDFKGLNETTVGKLSNDLTRITDATKDGAWAKITNAKELFDQANSKDIQDKAVEVVANKTWADTLQLLKNM